MHCGAVPTIEKSQRASSPPEPSPLMPLSPSASRTPLPIHMRDVKYRGYARDDGMWDVEAELVDQKTYDI